MVFGGGLPFYIYIFFLGKIPKHSHVSREPAVWGEGVIEER